MKPLTRTLSLAILLGGAALAAAAPPPEPAPDALHAPGPRRMHMDPQQMTERVSKSLALSAEQQQAVLAINERFTRQTEELRTAAEAARAQHRQAMRKLFEDRDAELRKVLDDKQYQQLLADQQQRRDRWRQHHGHGAGPGPGPEPGGPGDDAPPPPPPAE
jgi:Spy/CpxP family protein refolding chaperone